MQYIVIYLMLQQLLVDTKIFYMQSKVKILYNYNIVIPNNICKH